MNETMTQLVQMARAGDPEAFSRLYAEVWEDLYRYAFFLLGSREDAEDMVQETVLAAYAGIGKLRDPALFRPWIFRILSNKCRRHRGTYLTRPGELTEEMPDPGGDFTERVLLRSAVEELSGEDRMIIGLHVFAGYTSREIGEILGMKSATVRSREHRALEKLRRSEKGDRP